MAILFRLLQFSPDHDIYNFSPYDVLSSNLFSLSSDWDVKAMAMVLLIYWIILVPWHGFIIGTTLIDQWDLPNIIVDLLSLSSSYWYGFTRLLAKYSPKSLCRASADKMAATF